MTALMTPGVDRDSQVIRGRYFCNYSQRCFELGRNSLLQGKGHQKSFLVIVIHVIVIHATSECFAMYLA